MKKIVDARNIPCPGPVIEAKKALKEMKEGTLQVLVDNAVAVQNLTKLAGFMKLPVTSETLADGTLQVDISVMEHGGQDEGTAVGTDAMAGVESDAGSGAKIGVGTAAGTDAETNAGSGAGTDQENAAGTEGVSCAPDSRKKGLVAVLSADHMGEGDEVLGRALMKGFVYALTNLEHLPETILLYNGGARLSVEDAETLQDLKLLEAQGVEILTCGTCLNHYGLTERLAVGTVTNMYEIAEKMAAADSVIKP